MDSSSDLANGRETGRTSPLPLGEGKGEGRVLDDGQKLPRAREASAQANRPAHAGYDPVHLYGPQDISSSRLALDQAIIRFIDNIAALVARRWLFTLNLANAIIVIVAVLVPYIHLAGLHWLAQPIFAAYRFICVQNPDHSYFVFGYQMAMDQRMVAIFAATFVAGVGYGLVRHRLRPLDWRVFALLIAPLVVDGFTQLFGWRHSNWQLRTLTGALFGAATVWLAYPYFEMLGRNSAGDGEEPGNARGRGGAGAP
ncbi:MAG: DUF2085 domain-containing protein [Chloroflexi bacterium]|nr:DUF2085 domain-containing protein [Chloroflexota bacterium]